MYRCVVWIDRWPASSCTSRSDPPALWTTRAARVINVRRPECDEQPSILKVLTITRPETLVRWHRAGFRCYWRWKSRPQRGRPQIETELRVLIRRMSVENPLWGAPRIHGELLKLGLEVAQSSV